MPNSYWSNLEIDVMVAGPEGSRQLHLKQPFARVGSHPDCEIRLEGEGVPERTHYLHANELGLFCIDLLGDEAEGHYNGWLHPTAELPVGPYKISAQIRNQPLTSLLACRLDAKGSLPPPHPVLSLSSGGRHLRTLCLRRRLVLIGRSSFCGAQLVFNSVAPVHCVLAWEADTLWVIDLSAHEGLWQQDLQQTLVQFEIGASIEIGKVRLSYIGQSELHSDKDLPRLSSAGAPSPLTTAATTAATTSMTDEELHDQVNKLTRAAVKLRRRKRAFEKYRQRIEATLAAREQDIDSKVEQLAADQQMLEESLRNLELRQQELAQRKSTEPVSDEVYSPNRSHRRHRQRHERKKHDVTMPFGLPPRQTPTTLANPAIQSANSEASRPTQTKTAVHEGNQADVATGGDHAPPTALIEASNQSKLLFIAPASGPLSPDVVDSPTYRTAAGLEHDQSVADDAALIRVTNRLVSLSAARQRRLALRWFGGIVVTTLIAGVALIMAWKYLPPEWQASIPEWLNPDLE